MNKIAEFYSKVMKDETMKEKFVGIVGDTAPEKLSDEALRKLEILAKENGFNITAQEAKNYLKPAEGELTDDDLERAAGGKNAYDPPMNPINFDELEKIPGYDKLKKS